MTAVHCGYDRIDSMAEEFERFSPVMRSKGSIKSRSPQHQKREGQRQAAKVQDRARRKETASQFREIKASVSEYYRSLCHAQWRTKIAAAFADAFNGAASCSFVAPSDVPYDKEKMDDDQEEAFQFWVSRKLSTAISFVAGENVRMEVTRVMPGHVFLSATDVAREAQVYPNGEQFYRKVDTQGEFEELTRYFWLRLSSDKLHLRVSIVQKEWVHRNLETLLVLVTAPSEAFDQGTEQLLPTYRIFTTIHGEHFLGKRVPSAQVGSYRNKEFVDNSDPRPRSTYASYIVVRCGKSGIVYRNLKRAPVHLSQHCSWTWR